MAKHDWGNIFKAKNINELIDIYSGKSTLNSEAETFAGLELKNRDFDFQKIAQVHRRKFEEFKIDILEYENLRYVKSKFFKEQITYSIGFLIFLFMHIYYYNRIRIQEEYKYFQAILILIISFITILLAIPILTARWRFERFKKKKKRSIDRRIELFSSFLNTLS